MTLRDLLSLPRTVVPLRAASLREAVRVLVGACEADGRVTDQHRLREVTAEVHPGDARVLPTVLVPHFRTRAVPTLVVALGVATSAVATGAPEPRARLVVLVLAPPREAARYLQVIAAFGRALARPDVVAALHQATDAATILSLPFWDEVSLPGQLLVRDIMTAPVVSVQPDTALGDAAALLVRQGVEALPVVSDQGEVLGLLSNRELLRFLVPAYVQRVREGTPAPVRRVGDTLSRDPRGAPVREAMARSVLCLSEEQSVEDVARLMASKDVDRFPVVREGRLTGFLTRADIVRKVIGPM